MHLTRKRSASPSQRQLRVRPGRLSPSSHVKGPNGNNVVNPIRIKKWMDRGFSLGVEGIELPPVHRRSRSYESRHKQCTRMTLMASSPVQLNQNNMNRMGEICQIDRSEKFRAGQYRLQSRRLVTMTKNQVTHSSFLRMLASAVRTKSAMHSLNSLLACVQFLTLTSPRQSPFILFRSRT